MNIRLSITILSLLLFFQTCNVQAVNPEEELNLSEEGKSLLKETCEFILSLLMEVVDYSNDHPLDNHVGDVRLHLTYPVPELEGAVGGNVRLPDNHETSQEASGYSVSKQNEITFTVAYQWRGMSYNIVVDPCFGMTIATQLLEKLKNKLHEENSRCQNCNSDGSKQPNEEYSYDGRRPYNEFIRGFTRGRFNLNIIFRQVDGAAVLTSILFSDVIEGTEPGVTLQQEE